MSADRETRNERYKRGDCVDCGTQKHAAGRTRCNDCWAIYITTPGMGIA